MTMLILTPGQQIASRLTGSETGQSKQNKSRSGPILAKFLTNKNINKYSFNYMEMYDFVQG